MPGLYARIRIPVISGNGLLIPQEAISHDLRGPYVLAVNRENKIERRNVTTGSQEAIFQVIRSGLGGEEWVVVKGIQRAIPGRSVSPERLGLQEPTAAAPARQSGKC